jgi:hypothetical protein
MKRSLLLLILSLTLLIRSNGQTGGEGVFGFLQLTNSARSAALGGIQVALPGSDPEMVLQNPALLNESMSNVLTVNYTRYLAGIGYGYGAFVKDFGKTGRFAAGIQFVDYGQFVAADETGLITGDFSASDYALTLSYAKSFGSNFCLGATIKPVYSHLESYSSFGIVTDLGALYQSPDRLTSLALCFKNFGKQTTDYYDGGNKEKTAGSIQAGFIRQLQYAPLRFCVTAYDLNRWNPQVTATDPDGIHSTAPTQSPFDAIMRHLSLGAEIFPDQKISFRIGYNYRRRKELSVTNQSGLTGFSTGLGINLNSVHLNYALSAYQQNGMVHHFSLSANIPRWLSKTSQLHTE